MLDEIVAGKLQQKEEANTFADWKEVKKVEKPAPVKYEKNYRDNQKNRNPRYNEQGDNKTYNGGDQGNQTFFLFISSSKALKSKRRIGSPDQLTKQPKTRKATSNNQTITVKEAVMRIVITTTKIERDTISTMTTIRPIKKTIQNMSRKELTSNK